MRWLTLKYFETQAKISDYAAGMAAYKHWRQNAVCTKEEFEGASISAMHCACCIRFGNCRNCFLNTKKGCCDGLWQDAKNMYFAVICSEAPLKDFNAASAAVALYIKKKVSELKK